MHTPLHERSGLMIAYVGNFGPVHSTENHVAQALQHLGHSVMVLQENQAATWHYLLSMMGRDAPLPDLILWTRTGWDWPHTDTKWDHETAIDMQTVMLDRARGFGVPTAGFHLDLWFGLNRAGQVDEEPFFRCDLVVTADGGHDDEWRARNINHRWLPPGVSQFECRPGRFRKAYAAPIGFVGSWRPGYHEESWHRRALVDWLKEQHSGRCRFWPQEGHHAIRGGNLRDLYASVGVVVGDSCLVGTGLARYWSDRIPETIGRGGFLLHPDVDGLDEHFVDGEHLRTWTAGDWDQLAWLIDYYIEHEDERRQIARQGCAHVLAHHTYTVRMRQLLALVDETVHA